VSFSARIMGLVGRFPSLFTMTEESTDIPSFARVAKDSMRAPLLGPGRRTSAPYNSQPGRYSRVRYLFASGTLVIFMFALSYRSLTGAG